MSIEGISSSQIDSMLAMLRNTAAHAAPPVASPLGNTAAPSAAGSVSGSTTAVNFADMLKSSLSQANQVQREAQQMGNQFAAGDNRISLSDLMIKTQEANISLQTTVQFRNKVVAAYNDIMSMQI